MTFTCSPPRSPFNRNWISPVIVWKIVVVVYSLQIILNNDTQNSKFYLISQENQFESITNRLYMINFLPRSRKAWKIGEVDHGGIGMWGKWPCCRWFVGLNKQPWASTHTRNRTHPSPLAEIHRREKGWSIFRGFDENNHRVSSRLDSGKWNSNDLNILFRKFWGRLFYNLSGIGFNPSQLLHFWAKAAWMGYG